MGTEMEMNSEKWYRALYEESPSMYFTVDTDGKILSINKFGAEQLGYKVEELVGQSILKVIYEEDKEIILKEIAECLHDPRYINVQELRKVRRDGSIIWVKEITRAIRIDGGNIVVLIVCEEITDRKRVEEALRKAYDELEIRVQERTEELARANEILQAIINNSTTVIFVKDTQGRYIMVNHQYETLFHVKSEQIKGKTDYDIFPKEMADTLRSNDQKVFQARAPLEFDEVVQQDDGLHTYIAIKFPLYDPAEIPYAVCGISTDITERKQMEEKLRESEIRYRTLFEQSPDGVLIVDPQTAIAIEFNEIAHRQLGYTREEFKRLRISDYEAKEKPEETKAHIEKMLREGRDDFETIHRTKDGKLRNVMVTIKTIELSGRVFFHDIFRDISEHKRAEEALRESEQRFRTVFERSAIGIVLGDVEGRVMESNPALERMLGYTKEELRHKAFTEFTHPDDATPEWTMIQDIIAGKRDHLEIEKRYIRKDGEIIWVRLNASAVRGRQGEVLYGVALVDNITERKRAENELRKRTEDLSRANAELEQFTYIAAHDLQEPLRMISIFTQLLERRYKGKLDKDTDEFITYIVDGARHMQQMIEDLLAYSRVGTRGKPFEPTDLEDVFNQAVSNLKMAIEENNAQVTHDLLPTVMADTSQMVELFQNLIDNAIKFRREEPPRIHVSAEKKGNEWIVSVRDNGIGVSPEFMGRLFKIFQREYVAKYPGTGIGLAICRRIVERHEGRIWAESEPGKGSTFYFTIPARRNERQ